MTEKPRRLGRGLEALLAATGQAATAPEPSNATADSRELRRLPIADIRPNPYQPRKEFRPEDLADLERSLAANGLLQPITVRKAGGGWELVAGERRLRAATRLGWNEIPAVVRELDDRALLTLALVENLQRADLNPIEEADGYQRLVDEFGLTQAQVAEVVGKERSTVANTLRLLQLPASVRRMLQDGHLTLGHARALLAVPDERIMQELAREVVAKKLTVREIEQRARDYTARRRPPRAPRGGDGRTASPEIRRVTDQLRRKLQTDVQMVIGDGERGDLRIAFYSADDLDRVLDLILGPQRHHE